MACETTEDVSVSAHLASAVCVECVGDHQKKVSVSRVRVCLITSVCADEREEVVSRDCTYLIILCYK